MHFVGYQSNVWGVLKPGQAGNLRHTCWPTPRACLASIRPHDAIAQTRAGGIPASHLTIVMQVKFASSCVGLVEKQARQFQEVLTSSSRIFCTMKVATVFDSSLPISIVRRHNGMISVVSKKLMTSVSSTCAPNWQNWPCQRCSCENADMQCFGLLEFRCRLPVRHASFAQMCTHRHCMVTELLSPSQFAAAGLHTLTRAPMTPRLVSLRYSKGRVLLVVLRKGYRKRGT